MHMNECISESGCVCEIILPGSVSFQFLSYFTEKSQNSVDYTFLRWMILCARSARDVLYVLLSVANVCVCVCVTVQQHIRLERD